MGVFSVLGVQHASWCESGHGILVPRSFQSRNTLRACIVDVGKPSFIVAQVNRRAMCYPAEIFLSVGSTCFVLCFALSLIAGYLTHSFH